MVIGWVTIAIFSPATMVLCLVLLGIRDLVIAVENRVRSISYGTIGLGIVGAIAFAYLVAIPTISSFLDQFEERPTSSVVEELTTFEVLRIRSSKLAIFLNLRILRRVRWQLPQRCRIKRPSR